MKTTENIAKEYAIKNPNVSIAEAFREGYLTAFSDHVQEKIIQDRSFRANLDRVDSFLKQAIELTNRAMKELDDPKTFF